MEVLIIIGAVIAFIFLIDHLPSHLKKREFRKRSEPLFRLHNITVEDYNRSDEDVQRNVGMALYHFFEEMWKEFPTCAEPAELFERYLYHSSSKKLDDIFRLGFVVQSHPAPSAKAIATSFFACACMSARLRRDYADSRIYFYVSDATRSVFDMPLELCPTLQIFMWQKRFKEVCEKSPLHPFHIEYQKPDHKPETDDLAR